MPIPNLFFRYGWTINMFVSKLHDVEAAAVNVEMDVPLLEMRCDGFPDLDFRVHGLHNLPRRMTDVFAVGFGQDTQQFQFALYRQRAGCVGGRSLQKCCFTIKIRILFPLNQK